MLTDNGGEFSDVFAFENNLEGGKGGLPFFLRSHAVLPEGANGEESHAFSRYCAEGVFFRPFHTGYRQFDFSHINGVRRNIYSGKSPYEMFTFAFSEELAALLGISYVAPEDVVQSPRLLKG